LGIYLANKKVITSQSYNYEGMFKKGNLSTILEHMWPITVKELGDGFVIGTERVVTKASGTFRNPLSSAHTLFLYDECLLDAKVTSATGVPDSLRQQVWMGADEVSVKLKSTQQAVIVWGTPSDRFDAVQPLKSDQMTHQLQEGHAK
jgi:hypothetical protein